MSTEATLTGISTKLLRRDTTLQIAEAEAVLEASGATEMFRLVAHFIPEAKNEKVPAKFVKESVLLPYLGISREVVDLADPECTTTYRAGIQVYVADLLGLTYNIAPGGVMKKEYPAQPNKNFLRSAENIPPRMSMHLDYSVDRFRVKPTLREVIRGMEPFLTNPKGNMKFYTPEPLAPAT